MKKIYVVIIAIVFAGLGFVGGMQYGKSSVSQSNQQFSQNGGMRRQFNGGQNANAGAVSGQIVAKDDKSITVQLRDGGSKIVFYSTSTQIGKSVSGAASDLNNNEQVSVFGTQNSDGSITAQSIQIRPVMPNSGTSQPNAAGGQ